MHIPSEIIGNIHVIIHITRTSGCSVRHVTWGCVTITGVAHCPVRGIIGPRGGIVGPWRGVVGADGVCARARIGVRRIGVCVGGSFGVLTNCFVLGIVRVRTRFGLT